MGWAYNVPDGTPNKGPMIAGVCLTFTALSLILVIMRLYVRLMIVKAPGKGKEAKTRSLSLLSRHGALVVDDD
jgi:hypothetical protein